MSGALTTGEGVTGQAFGLLTIDGTPLIAIVATGGVLTVAEGVAGQVFALLTAIEGPPLPVVVSLGVLTANEGAVGQVFALLTVDGTPLLTRVATGAGAPPTITAVSQSQGTIDGNTLVTLTGTNLDALTSSTLGAVQPGATFTAATVRTNPHAAGAFVWTATNAFGSSAPRTYVYLPHPVVSFITPDQGPTLQTTAAVVTMVTGLPTAPATGCPVVATIGGLPLTGVVISGALTFPCVVPTGPAGPADLVVTVDGVASTGGVGAWTWEAGLAFQISGIPSQGQSLAVGGGSVPTSLVQVGGNLKLGDSLVATFGWYWGNGYPVVVGQRVFPASPATGFVYVVDNAGTGLMGLVQPVWPVVVGNTVTDANGVVYRCLAAQAPPFDTSNPGSATLAFVPLVAPTRPVAANAQPALYPMNTLGESTGMGLLNQLATDTTSVAALIDVGIGGQGIIAIGPGGASNAWAALTFELTAQRSIAVAAGKTYGVPFAVMTTGEADDLSYTFVADLLAYDASLQTLIHGITGQVAQIPLVMSQQNTSPTGNQGLPLSALSQLFAAQSNPLKLVLSGPKWQYTYAVPTQHLVASGYVLNGEKSEEAALVALGGRFWRPIAPSDVALSVGNTVLTLTMDVPHPPLVFDTSFGQPHQAGALAAVWPTAKGFEVHQAIANVVGATNATPIVIATQQAHGLSTGDVVNVGAVLGNPAANSQQHAANWTVTVVDATHFSLNGSAGNGAYVTGGMVRTAISAATNATPIVVTTAKPHGLASGDVVGIFDAGGNTAANGSWVVTVVDATHFSCNGSVGNGAYTGAGGVVRYLPITSVALPSPTTVQLTMPVAVGNGVSVAAALIPDDLTDFSAALPNMRCANLFDSDPFEGISGVRQPNACVTFLATVPFHFAAVQSISPNKVSQVLAAPQSVTIVVNRGATGKTTASLGATALTSVTVVNDQTLTAVIPAGTYTAATVDVTIGGGGETVSPLVAGFAFLPEDPSLIFLGQLQFWGEGDSLNHAGAAVTSWADKGPLAQGPLPAVGAPTWNAAASTPIPATPSMNTSAGNYLDLLNFTFGPAGTDITLIIVSKVTSGGPAELVATGEPTIELRISNTQPTKIEQISNASTAATFIAGGTVLGAWHTFAGWSTGTAAGSVGVTYDNQTPVSIAVAGGTPTLAVKPLSVGARHGGSVPCSQEVVCLVVVQGVATALQLSRMQAYTSNKWGV